LKELTDIFTEPIKRNLPLTIFLIVIQMSAHIYFAGSDGRSLHDIVTYLRFTAYYAVATSYVISLIYGLLFRLNHVAAKVFAAIAIAWILILEYADICCHGMLGVGLNEEFITVFAETNGAESREFLATYINGSTVAMALCFSILFAAAGWGLYRYADSIRRFAERKAAFVCMVLALIVSVIGSVRHVMIDDYNYSAGYLDSELKRTLDVLSYRPSPEITGNPNLKLSRLDGTQPQQIVIIVGESLSKTHMSLYGYHRDTNPRLSAIDTSRITVMDSVMSPAYITLEAFKRFMTGWDGDDDGWTASDNIIDIAKAAGYATRWLSNQNNKGMWDNVAAKFAKRSDVSVWVGDQNLGPERKNLDGELLPLVERAAADTTRALTIVHLNGSHPQFSERYPKSFDVFKPKTYNEYAENLRREMAEYDNTVLYNDYVVSEIIARYADDDAIVIYFSDHSLQLGETSTGLVGHALDANNDQIKDYCRRIPMLVYRSPKFDAAHPDLVSAVDSLTSRPFNTIRLIDLVTRLTQSRIID
jgi:heptose-I-phosphate ethanolaminephosphotransferase